MGIQCTNDIKFNTGRIQFQPSMLRLKEFFLRLGGLSATQVQTEAQIEAEDDKILDDMGYDKVLYRGLGSFTNFAFGFTEVGVLVSIVTTWNYGLQYGGPTEIVWGFFVTFVMTMIVSLSMAEISSAYPSAGCVYHWSAQLVPENQAPLVSYICGWFNFIGNCAGDAGFAASFATVLNAAITISQPLVSKRRLTVDAHVLAVNEPSGMPTSYPTMMPTYKPGYDSQVGVAVAIGLLWLCGFLNIFRVDKMGWVNGSAAVIHLSTIVILIVSVLAYPKVLNNGNFVFTDFYTDDYSNTNINDKSYVGAIGLLFGAFCFSGYEASGHMAEETNNAKLNAPRGIILTNLVGGVSGICVILSLLFATTDISLALNGDPSAFGDTGNAVINLFTSRLPLPLARAITWLIVINLFFAVLASVSVSGRIGFALMRDNGLPFSGFFSQSVGEGSPFLVIAFLLFFDSLIMLLLLNDNSSTAFNSIIQLTAVGFQVSYAIPIICKVIWRPTNFPVTPFDLGNWSFPVGVISSLWLIGTSCIFFLPTVFPVSVDAMNWLIVVVSGCIALGTVNWIFNSRFNFTGPKRVAIAVPEDDMPRGLVIDNKA